MASAQSTVNTDGDVEDIEDGMDKLQISKEGNRMTDVEANQTAVSKKIDDLGELEKHQSGTTTNITDNSSQEIHAGARPKDRRPTSKSHTSVNNEGDSTRSEGKSGSCDNYSLQSPRKVKSEGNTVKRDILNSSTDTASEGEEERTATSTHQLPEEIVRKKLQVTEEKQRAIEKQTRGQANNPLWFRHREGRITASKAKKFVGKGDVGTLVKDIIQISNQNFTSIPAIKYGIDNEAVALGKYKQQKEAQSVNITVDVCGLFVDLEFGQLAASPDGLVTDPSKEDPHGLVEIKCIYSCRDISPKEAIENKGSSEKGSSSQFPLKAVGETVIMKESHPHYYQIQMQMGVTNRRWCDYVLFTKEDEDVFILRVNFDPGFWRNVKEKLLDFHAMNIVPALVAQGFHKK